jgi:hypothetical protein
MLVNEWPQRVFSQVDGVIGLSKTFWKPDGSKYNSLLIDYFYESGLIS